MKNTDPFAPRRQSSTRFRLAVEPAIALVAIFVAAAAFQVRAAAGSLEHVPRVQDVAQVWSGHPVGFALLTHGAKQFVAFYDEERRMTVGARSLTKTNWHFERLPEKVGWDSHNSITMAVDAADHLHLSGNMHVHPLVYFRTTRPLDISSFSRLEKMIGDRERRCTYPKFITGPKGEFIFTYRDGSSGNGQQIFNVYDVASQTWKRLLDAPLTNGEGLRNAYFHGPILGPDGFYHLCYVWRDTPDCATNHDLSYARSRDLVHWEKSTGEPFELPITRGTSEIVDPVPAGGGMINGNTVIGFDSRRRPVLSYHKYDAHGRTQLYSARLEHGRWQIYQTSDWDYRWEFSGGGTIIFEIGFAPVQVNEAGELTQSYRHKKHGSGAWVLEENTLRPLKSYRPKSPLAGLDRQLGPVPEGMLTRASSDLGSSGEPGIRYQLRWHTLPQNRDRPHPGPPPPPATLRLVRLSDD
jgi:hypothetical protein